MSVNTITKDTVDRMMSPAFGGDLDAAFDVLQQSGLTEDQKVKIAVILTEPRDSKEQCIAAMQQRIIAVIEEANIASPAASSEQAASSQATPVAPEQGRVSSDRLAPPAVVSLSATQSLQTVSPSVAVELYSDILGKIFYHLFQCDFTTLSAVACVNKNWNNSLANFWAGCDLKQLCPELTILDAKAQGVQCDDEPEINERLLLKSVRELNPHVEGNAGLTQLTMTKGTTYKQLKEIAGGEGMTFQVLLKRITAELGDVAVEKSYRILISNNVLLGSRDKDYNPQKTFVAGLGCEMPTIQEYLALCVHTFKVFKKCLYGETPWTLGCSSTHIGGNPVLMGACRPEQLVIDDSIQGNAETGAGGTRRV
jgi:hypothetical protein